MPLLLRRAGLESCSMSRHQLSPSPSEQPAPHMSRARPSPTRGAASGRPASGAPSKSLGGEAWLPDSAAAEVLLVTGYDFLQGEVEQIVAAAGGQLRVVADVADAAKYWD